MKKVAIAILFFMSNFSIAASSLSEQDIYLMAASLKTVEIYKARGMNGLFNDIGQCYAQLNMKNPVNKNDIEFCIAIDMSGVFIDFWMAQISGFPRDKRFADAVAGSRMHSVLERFGVSKSGADSAKVFRDIEDRVQENLNRAVSMPTNSPEKLKDPNKCLSQEMLKWEKAREKEVKKWCADLAKIGQECRLSVGLEELAKQQALDEITSRCQ